MSQQAWAIYAWSPSTNQRVRQFRLADVTTNYTQQQAQQHADAFAGIQNRDQYMHVQDWIGLAELETHGIDTIPGYLPPQR